MRGLRVGERGEEGRLEGRDTLGPRSIPLEEGVDAIVCSGESENAAHLR